MYQQISHDYQLMPPEQTTEQNQNQIYIPVDKPPKRKTGRIICLVVLSSILIYLITMSVINFTQIHSHDKELNKHFKEFQSRNHKLNQMLKRYFSVNETFSLKLRQQEQKEYQLYKDMNETIEAIKEAQRKQNKKLQILVADNPFFTSSNTHQSLQIVGLHHVKSIQNENQNALLDFSLVGNKNYSFQFKVFFEGATSTIQIGVSTNDQNWKTVQSKFSKFSNGYAISLNNGQKINNDSKSQYATNEVRTSGDSVSMNVDTSKGTISFKINKVDQGVAFENIDFNSKDFYPAVCLSKTNEEVKLIKVETSID